MQSHLIPSVIFKGIMKSEYTLDHYGWIYYNTVECVYKLESLEILNLYAYTEHRVLAYYKKTTGNDQN
jgi:hypothetical protein